MAPIGIHGSALLPWRTAIEDTRRWKSRGVVSGRMYEEVARVFKRLFWFVLGAVAGATAVIWVRRKAEAVAERLTPSAILEELRSVAVALWEKATNLRGSEPQG